MHLKHNPDVVNNPNVHNSILLQIQETQKEIMEIENFLNSSTMKKIEINRAENFEEMTKYFFNYHNPKQYKTIMTSIKWKGNILRQQSEKAEAACEFYKNLYEQRKTSAAAQKKLLGPIKNGFITNSDQNNKMDCEITLEKVKNILLKLPKGKAPGPDGLISEFYIKFEEEMSVILTKLFVHCLEQNKLPESMNQANIHLIFKKGSPDDLANWRPISLLNSDYKILSKLINNRITPYLPQIVSPDKKGLIPTVRNIKIQMDGSDMQM